MLTIDTATDADRADLAARMTEADRAELSAAGVGMECLQVQAKALRWREQLVCMFGVERLPEQGCGVPWMLCTDTLAHVPRRAMADVSRRVVTAWRGDYRWLVNHVHRHNVQALRFLRWLGFTIHETPVGRGGDFFTFTWGNPDV